MNDEIPKPETPDPATVEINEEITFDQKQRAQDYRRGEKPKEPKPLSPQNIQALREAVQKAADKSPLTARERAELDARYWRGLGYEVEITEDNQVVATGLPQETDLKTPPKPAE